MIGRRTSPSSTFDYPPIPFRIPQPQDDFVALTAMVAVGIGSIAVDLQDIPNGPIRFMVQLDSDAERCSLRLVFVGRSNKPKSR